MTGGRILMLCCPLDGVPRAGTRRNSLSRAEAVAFTTWPFQGHVSGIVQYVAGRELIRRACDSSFKTFDPFESHHSLTLTMDTGIVKGVYYRNEVFSCFLSRRPRRVNPCAWVRPAVGTIPSWQFTGLRQSMQRLMLYGIVQME